MHLPHSCGHVAAKNSAEHSELFPFEHPSSCGPHGDGDGGGGGLTCTAVGSTVGDVPTCGSVGWAVGVNVG